MRTNTAVLGAAAFAVGALSSATAQNVYSVNVVGYVNVVIPHGFSINANPLNNADNSVSNLFAAASAPFSGGSWNGPAAGGAVYLWSGTGFIDGDGNDPYAGWSNPSLQLPPGTGYFFNNQGPAFTNTYVGTVVQGGSTNAIHTGYNVVGSQWPVATNVVQLGLDIGLSDASPTNGAGDVIYFLENGGFVGFQKNPYSPYTWSPTGPLCDATNGPLIGIGQGFYYLNNSGVPFSWIQNFTVQ